MNGSVAFFGCSAAAPIAPSTGRTANCLLKAIHSAAEVSGFLVGPTVFKTDETATGRLAGSIPVRLR
jgi:hypothetical protein